MGTVTSDPLHPRASPTQLPLQLFPESEEPNPLRLQSRGGRHFAALPDLHGHPG